jgi:hypothetical protein
MLNHQRSLNSNPDSCQFYNYRLHLGRIYSAIQNSCDTNPLSRTIKSTFLVISWIAGNIRLPLSSSCLMSHLTIFPQSPRPEAWGTFVSASWSMRNYLWALPDAWGTFYEPFLKHEELFVSAAGSMRNYLWALPEAWGTICERCLKYGELFVSAAWRKGPVCERCLAKPVTHHTLLICAWSLSNIKIHLVKT